MTIYTNRPRPPSSREEIVAHELRVMLWDRNNEVDLPPSVGEVARTILDALDAWVPARVAAEDGDE